MQVRAVVWGVAAGVVLAAGGIALVGGATDDASAQSGDRFATKAEVAAASKRASAAINMGKRVWNLLGVYEGDPGEIVSASSGPITQQRAVGGGIPLNALTQEARDAIGAGGAQGPAGPSGPAGSSGPQGVQGPAGPAGLADVEAVLSPVMPVAGSSAGQTADCPAGKIAIAGGHVQTAADGSPITVTGGGALLPIRSLQTNTDQWFVIVAKQVVSTQYFRTQAICASVSS